MPETGFARHAFEEHRDAVATAMRRSLEDLKMEPATPHGPSAPRPSGMTEEDAARFDIGRELGRDDGNRTATRVHDLYEYFVQKRRALERWAKRLDLIVRGKPVAVGLDLSPMCLRLGLDFCDRAVRGALS